MYIVHGRIFLLFVLLGCLLTPIASLRAAASLGPVTPNDPFWERQWYLRQIHMPEAWRVTTGSRNVVVAILDGGVDLTHPELRENVWTNLEEVPEDGVDNDQNGFVDDRHGWNFVSRNNDLGPIQLRNFQAEESWSHGTFVASLIGAKGNNRAGIAGVAWQVQLMPLVVLDGDGFGNMQSIISAIRYAIQKRVDIINLSLSGHEYNEELELVIKEARQAGIFVVAATGNYDFARGGINIDERPMYPVCMDGAINAVFGVGGTDTLDQKAPYANFGRNCTDIAAPAQAFFGARPTYRRPSDTGTSTGYYLDGMTGTSLAAPLVSGAAVLLKSIRPDLSPKQLEDALRYSADPIEENLTFEERGRMGSGRLNVARAIAWVSPTPTPPTFKLEVRDGVTIFSAYAEKEWRLWTQAEPVLMAHWVNTSTVPEAKAVVTASSTWRYEVWKPAINTVTFTTLWTRRSTLPAPSANVSRSHLLFLSPTSTRIEAIVLDSRTGLRTTALLSKAMGRGPMELLWWPEQSAWVIWSKMGHGVLVNLQGKIVANIEQVTPGSFSKNARLVLAKDQQSLRLMRGTKLLSSLRVRRMP
jgi:hypothetical protein